MPVLASELFEDLHLSLTHPWLGGFGPLGHIEGQREKLFLVRWVQIKFIDSGFVFGKTSLDAILNVLIRAQTWYTFWSHFVDKLLQLVGVALNFVELLSITEGNIFKTMDFTQLPEDGVAILTLASDLEDFSQVSLLANALYHVFEELGLGKRVLVIHGQVV